MTKAQLEQLMKDIAEVTKEYVAHELASRDSRIKALEERPQALSYQGVWTEGKMYPRGTFVTRAGSIFHANCVTGAKPGESSDWTLAVKRGADGKDAR